MGQIIITFLEDGTTETKVEGVKGKSCKDVTAFIEKGLGKKISDKLTPEFYQKEENNNVIRRR